MKKTAVLAALMAVLLSVPVFAAGSSRWGTYQGYNVVRVVVNGRVVTGDVPAVNLNGRTMVPLRAIAEALGVQVQWDDANKTAIIGSGTANAESVGVSVDPALQPRLPEIQANADALYKKVSSDLGLPGKPPLDTRVFSSRSGFADFLVAAFGDSPDTRKMGQYACGVASDGVGTVILADEAECGDYRLILAHEFSHRVLASAGVEFPAWFDEGLAQQEEIRAVYGGDDDPLANRLSGENLEAVLEQAQAGRLQGFAESNQQVLDTLDSYPAEQQGQVAVAFLLQHGDIATLRQFIGDAAREGVDAAFQKAYGVPMANIEQYLMFNLANANAHRPKGVRIRLRLSGSGQVVAFSEGMTDTDGRSYKDADVTIDLPDGQSPQYSLSGGGSGWTLDQPLQGQANVYIIPDSTLVYHGKKVEQEVLILAHGVGMYYWAASQLLYSDGTWEDVPGVSLPDGSVIESVESY